MTDELLYCVMELGEKMVATGAEIRRVEDTMGIVCRAYGAKKVDVFSTTSLLIATAIAENGTVLNQTRRIQASGSNIAKLDALNKLARYMKEKRPDVAEVQKRLEEIEQVKNYGIISLILGYALVAGAFTVFFGSRSFTETLVSTLIGGLLGVLTIFGERLGMQKPFLKLICSFIACSLAFASTAHPSIDTVDLIIIGNIMTLIPGVGLTKALRDLFTGDVITGILRSIEALLLGAVIAFGYVTAAFIFG